MSLRNLSVITGLPFEVPPIEDWTEKLKRNGTWEEYPKKKIVKGTDTGEWMPKGLRRPEEIDTIIIHHMASVSPLENQAAYHVNNNQWPGLAYHLCIYKGEIIQANDLLSMTFHASGHNTYTVSISIHGNLEKREMTDKERELLYAAILTVKSALPIKHILGHNEVNATACPCTSMNRIRDDIEDLEVLIQRRQGWTYQLDLIKSVNNELNYWAELIKAGENEGKARWAMARYMRVHDLMKRESLF
jgi:hypothetical protein